MRHTINVWMKFNTEKNACCRVLHYASNEKLIYNGQQKNDSDVFFYW